MRLSCELRSAGGAVDHGLVDGLILVVPLLEDGHVLVTLDELLRRGVNSLGQTGVLGNGHAPRALHKGLPHTHESASGLLFEVHVVRRVLGSGVNLPTRDGLDLIRLALENLDVDGVLARSDTLLALLLNGRLADRARLGGVAMPAQVLQRLELVSVLRENKQLRAGLRVRDEVDELFTFFRVPEPGEMDKS